MQDEKRWKGARLVVWIKGKEGASKSRGGVRCRLVADRVGKGESTEAEGR